MSINKVILLGNLGKEPEIKNFDGGNKIASFTLATTKKGYTSKNGTTIPDKTEWHNVIVFNGLVDVCEKYLHKGSKVYVEGEIRYREYEKEGQKRYVTEILCDNFEMCGEKTNANTTVQTQAPAPTMQVQTQAPAPTMQVQSQTPKTTPINPFAKPIFDETPFPPTGVGGDDLPF